MDERELRAFRYHTIPTARLVRRPKLRLREIIFCIWVIISAIAVTLAILYAH